MNRDIKVCFDVDGTLIHDERNPDLCDTPRYDIIMLFHVLELVGCDLYIWSGGGLDYATRWAQKLGLKAKIIEKGDIEPDIAIDDQYITLGKVNIIV
jgi:hydroxymethylpyrimidine pyrophosphatase-like HAD family hydrolase